MHAPLSIRDGSTAFKRSRWARCFICGGLFQLLTKLNLLLPPSSLSVSQHFYFLLLSLSPPAFFWLSSILLPLVCPSELMDLAPPCPCCFWPPVAVKLGMLLPLRPPGRREGRGGRSCPVASLRREVSGRAEGSACPTPSQSQSRIVCH